MFSNTVFKKWDVFIKIRMFGGKIRSLIHTLRWHTGIVTNETLVLYIASPVKRLGFLSLADYRSNVMSLMNTVTVDLLLAFLLYFFPKGTRLLSTYQTPTFELSIRTLSYLINNHLFNKSKFLTSFSSLGSRTMLSNRILSPLGSSGFPLEAGTTPRRSSPSSVSVPVLSKQTQSILPDTLIVLGEMQ